MTTMNEKYGDGSDHEVCDKCGLCKDCGDCLCDHEAGWPGDIALKGGYVVATIGCPHCGVSVTGKIVDPVCGWCDKPFWPGWEKKK